MDMQTWRDGWARATDAAEAMRVVLASLGVPEAAWIGVRPVVTKTGRPYVELGTVQADLAEQIAEAFRVSAR
jgi:hypothetical protein